MPTYEVTIGGRTFDIDAASEADLPAAVEQAVGALPAQMQQQPAAQPQSALTDITAGVTRGALPTIVGGAVGGAIGGIGGVGVGAIPGAAGGAEIANVATTAGDILVPMVNKALGTRFATPSEAWSKLADLLEIPKAEGAAGRYAQAATEGAAGALTGAGLGKALLKTSSPMGQAIGKALSTGVKEQAIAGAVGGVGGEAGADVARELGLDENVQAVARLAAGIATGASAAKAQMAFGAKPVDAVGQLFEELKLRPPTTSEALPPETLFGKAFRSFSANIPVIGGAAAEEKRAIEVAKGLEDLVNSYGVKFGSRSKFDEQVFNDFANARSSELKNLTGSKSQLIEDLVPNGIVPSNNSMRVLDEEINRLNAANPTALAPIVNKLEGMKSALASTTLDNFEINRSITGTMLKDPSLASIAKQGDSSVMRVFGAIKDDMREFIKQHAGDSAVAKWEDINKKLNGMADELGNLSIKRALNLGEANPEVIGKMLSDPKSKSGFDKLISGLTPEGRQAAKSSIIQDMVEKSMKGEGGAFSPTAFQTQFRNLQPNISRLFDASEQKVLKGWNEVLSRTQFSRMFAPDVPTGQRTVVATTMTALGAFLPLKLLGMAGAYHAYESQVMRNLLTRIAENPANKADLIQKAGSQGIALMAKSLGQAMIDRGVPVTFDAQNTQSETVGGATIHTDTAHGYRAVSTNSGKVKLYDAGNNLVGVFKNMDAARKHADKQAVNKIKLPKE